MSFEGNDESKMKINTRTCRLNQRSSTMNFIEPLYRLSMGFAVVPPYSFTIPMNNRVNCKMYAVFVMMVFLTGYAFSTYGRIVSCYPYFPAATLMVTDALFNFCQTVLNIISILIPTCLFSCAFINFMDAFYKIDVLLYNTGCNIKKRSIATFYIQLIIGHLGLIVLFAYDAYVWLSRLGFVQFRAYAFRDLQNYAAFITVMLMYNLIVSIKQRFESLNENLEHCTVSFLQEDFLNSFSILRTAQVQPTGKVRQLSVIYEVLIEQVSSFNKIFGWQILITTAAIVVGLLNTLDILLAYGIYQNHSQGVQFGGELIGLSVLWSLFQLILGTIIANSCDCTTREAQRTSEICYKILLNLPTAAEKSQDRIFKEHLLLLAQLSTQKSPTFSAAGFFKIDYSMLLALFGSVTSYVIVVIQFNK